MFVEKLIQKGYEVIFFTEAIDEYVMTHLTECDDKKFQDASKDDLKLGKDDKKGMKKLKVDMIIPSSTPQPHLTRTRLRNVAVWWPLMVLPRSLCRRGPVAATKSFTWLAPPGP